jgi:hypothetical protein
MTYYRKPNWRRDGRKVRARQGEGKDAGKDEGGRMILTL